MKTNKEAYLEIVVPQIAQALSDDIPVRVQLSGNSVENFEVIAVTIFKKWINRIPILTFRDGEDICEILITPENIASFWFQYMGKKHPKKPSKM